jgi:hypothetical protein
MTTQQQYEILRNELNEQQWRLFLGTEALKIGSGGISQVAALSGERARVEGRIRKAGGGRKKAAVTDASLQRELEALLEPKGDPMSLIKWTSHSLTQLTEGALPSLGIAARGRHWPTYCTSRAIPSR